jgi:CRP-like cAMP-binding protein
MQDRAEVRRRILDQATLARLPLFSELTPSERDQLFDHLAVERYAPGDLVFRQGDGGTSFYQVVQGRFDVLRRGDDEAAEALGHQVNELGPGDYFGEIALLTDEPRNASVRAATPALCYRLSREGFAQLLASAPASRASVDRLALERISQMRAGLGARVEQTA